MLFPLSEGYGLYHLDPGYLFKLWKLDRLWLVVAGHYDLFQVHRVLALKEDSSIRSFCSRTFSIVAC